MQTFDMLILFSIFNANIMVI